MAKETIEVFAIAIGVVVFLERGRKEEWGALGPVMLLCAAQRLSENLLRTTRRTNIRHG
jgi:hypothetical protein